MHADRHAQFVTLHNLRGLSEIYALSYSPNQWLLHMEQKWPRTVCNIGRHPFFQIFLSSIFFSKAVCTWIFSNWTVSIIKYSWCPTDEYLYNNSVIFSKADLQRTVRTAWIFVLNLFSLLLTRFYRWNHDEITRELPVTCYLVLTSFHLVEHPACRLPPLS